MQPSILSIFLVNFNSLGLLMVSSLLSGTPPICFCLGCPSWQGSLGGGGLVTKSCPTLVTPWTVAHEAPLALGFPRQEYWSGLPLPSPGDLPDPGIELRSPALQADSLPTEHQGKPCQRQETGASTRLTAFFYKQYFFIWLGQDSVAP